ncbi:hypothetical protein ACBJ59_38995 [Nonomuraea sp. MTCD27]|uniref:hypothetical protein n=1 Tax=Nonomuraea sp. MTCD27 TaxID=1676747 RepID=UPI0035BFFB35
MLTLVVMAVVLLGGAALMAARRQEHGRGSVLGIVGCVVLLLGLGISALYIFWVPELVATAGPDGYGPILAILSLVSFVFQVAGTGLLIFAVIARRTPRPQPQQPYPGQPQAPWQQQGSWPQEQQGSWSQEQQQPPYQQQPQQPPFQQPPGWQTPPQPPFGEGQR